jgi:hypothetical protein
VVVCSCVRASVRAECLVDMICAPLSIRPTDPGVDHYIKAHAAIGAGLSI